MTKVDLPPLLSAAEVNRRWDLVQLTQLDKDAGVTGERVSAFADQTIQRFAALPFVAIPSGSAPPPSIKTNRVLGNYPIDRLRLLKALDWFLTNHVDIVNLSIELIPQPYDDLREPLQIATRSLFEHGIPVIVAAGNAGPAGGTLQPLARAPWVIAVGAVDEAGKLLKSSSRGTPEGQRPSVVSEGTPADVGPPMPGWLQWGPGTSFAAAKVTKVACLIQACLRLSVADLNAQQGGNWQMLSHPIPIPHVGIADTGVQPERLPPPGPLVESLMKQGASKVRLSRGDRTRQWYATLADAFRNAKLTWAISADGPAVRRALEAAARPLSGYAPHEVGAGIVSLQDAETFLSGLTASRWLEVFDPDALSALRPQLGHLDATVGPLWSRDEIDAFDMTFASGAYLYVARVI